MALTVDSSLTIKNVTGVVIGKNSLQMSTAVYIYRNANKELRTLTSFLIVGIHGRSSRAEAENVFGGFSGVQLMLIFFLQSITKCSCQDTSHNSFPVSVISPV